MIDFTSNGTIPAWLRNGEVEIRVEGRTVITDFPIARFFANGAANNPDGSVVLLGSGFTILGGDRIEILVKVPSSADLGTDKHFVRVDLVGFLDK